MRHCRPPCARTSHAPIAPTHYHYPLHPLHPRAPTCPAGQGFDAFKASLLGPDGATPRVDLVLSCVDNYEARITINQVCWVAPGGGEQVTRDFLFTC